MPSSAWCGGPPRLRPFPTRRSSDLSGTPVPRTSRREAPPCLPMSPARWTPRSAPRRPLWTAGPRRRRPPDESRTPREPAPPTTATQDRKSTRLNSSHVAISYAVFCLVRRPPPSAPFPYTTLFRSVRDPSSAHIPKGSTAMPTDVSGAVDAPERTPSSTLDGGAAPAPPTRRVPDTTRTGAADHGDARSEEHTSELQSRGHLVCRLLLGAAAPPVCALSLHDALPICPGPQFRAHPEGKHRHAYRCLRRGGRPGAHPVVHSGRRGRAGAAHPTSPGHHENRRRRPRRRKIGRAHV